MRHTKKWIRRYGYGRLVFELAVCGISALALAIIVSLIQRHL